MVAAVERKEGSIKRVWVRYRNKLKGLPLEFVRLAVADEIEAQNISSEAFELIEKELTEGRTKALVAPEVPQLTDKNYPVMEFSDDDEPRHVDEEETKTASVLDDVPMAMHKGGHEREVETLRDPALWPFPKRKQVFEPKMSLDQAAQRTKHHLQEMKMKLEGKSTGAAASSSARATAGDTTAAEHSAAAPAKADRKKKGDQNPKSAKAPRTALVVEGVRSVLESYVVLPLQSPLETVWHDGDEAAMINKAAEEFEPKPDFPSPWLPAPGMVDLMPPRHFVGFEQTPVVKSPEHEVNYTRGTWEKPWPNTPVPHVHVPKHVDMLPEMPPALTQPISEAQMRSLTRAKIMWPDQDSWIYDADIEELWRVHQCPREKLFVPQEPTWPSSIKRDWFVGPRVTWMYFEDEPEVVVVDNFRWQGCNPSLRTTDGRLWRGFTRFWVRVPSPISDLNAWIDARVMVEELWRAAQQMMSLYFREKDEYKVDWNEVFVLQADVADMVGNFPVVKRLVTPKPMKPHQCYIETQSDIQDLPTGKVRLELKWNSLSQAWKQAFEEPIKDALDVYFKYDAVAPVFDDEDIGTDNILPSRFVLVNKSDPRNVSPLDEQLEDARLKARWVVSGHRDKEAGLWETEAPTASLMAHNLLCFFAAQFKWTMFFGDITAAFLQGESLHPDRKVLVAIPRGYPDFVQQFLGSKLPKGARPDLVRFTKGGFGLAESPRLWFKKLQKTLTRLGAKEWLLIPGVFSVFVQGEIVAMIACHVDDIRLIGHPEKARPVWEAIKKEFTFGEWRNVAEDWSKFCGRYERQLPDGTIEVQMDEYCEKLQFPPKRTRGNSVEKDGTELTMTERKWVGHVCGQLSWLARQCRGDLLFGVSRVQQLAGVGDPAALDELYILVERAKELKTMRFKPLDVNRGNGWWWQRLMPVLVECPVEEARVEQYA